MRIRTVLTIALVATALIPLSGGLYPPLQDLPNHLLEADIIAAPHRYAPWFRLHLHAAPNLLTQLLLAAFCHLMHPQIASIVLLLTIQLLYGLGALALCRTLFNRSTAVLALLMLWSWHFFLWRGYLNYSLGCALVLWGITLYHRARQRSAPSRLMLFVPFTALLYSVHLLCLGVWLSYVILHEIFENKRLSGATIASVVLSVTLAVWYAISLPSGEGLSWEYGSGLWKISSLKRILAMPVVSTLTNQLLMSALIIYNLGKYLLFAGTLLSTPWYARTLSRGTGLWMVLWVVAYVVLPTKTGALEVDNRVIFIPLLLASAYCVQALYLRGVQRTALAIGLGSALVLQVVVSTIQYAGGSTDLHSRLEEQQAMGKLDKSALAVHLRSNEALRRNAVQRMLEPLRLHTDETQRTLPDLHAECYLFMDSPKEFGAIPHVFETSIVRSITTP